MAELQYSDDALNVRNNFFKVDSIVYVEGDDDVLFWQEVFAHIPDARLEIEAVGGSNEIDQIIEKIKTGQVNSIAARDADFLAIQGTSLTHPRIIYTYGYSIENSLYTIESLTILARLWCKTNKIPLTECATWLTSLASEAKQLIHLDLANRLSNCGISTITDNCTRFMTSQTSCTPCSNKISTQAIVGIQTIPQADQTHAEAALGDLPENLLRWIRGHFLATAVLKFIHAKAKALGRKIDLSYDALYATAISNFGRTLPTSHPHKNYYLQIASSAYQSL